MRACKHMGRWLAVLGACVGIGSMIGCSSKNSQGRDSGLVSTGGVLGLGGIALVGTGGGMAGAGGAQGPDAAIGTVLGTGGRLGTAGAHGDGGRMGTGGAPTVDGGRICGTIAGLTCGAGEFCDLSSKCGTIHDAPGICEATGPQVGCTREYRPVCGCDGISYGNDCMRRAAGVLKLKDGSCDGPPDGGVGDQAGSGGTTGIGDASGSGGAGGTTGTSVATEYAGCYWAGGLDHATLEKRDYAKDECVVLNLDAPSTSLQGYEVTLPNNWGLRSALISSCGSAGSAVAATAVSGTISWGTGYPPETANVDVVLYVTTVDGGPTFTYVFSAQDIALPYGC